MKLHHVEWASHHDWFAGCAEIDTPEGVIWSVCCVDVVNGSYIAFTDYQELREWAGY